MKLIRITSIYGEIFIRKEIKRNKLGVFTDKGFVPFEDIESIDILGEITTQEQHKSNTIILGDKENE